MTGKQAAGKIEPHDELEDSESRVDDILTSKDQPITAETRLENEEIM